MAVEAKCAHGAIIMFQDCEICKLETRVMVAERSIADIHKAIHKLEEHRHKQIDENRAVSKHFDELEKNMKPGPWCPTCGR